MVKTLPAKQMGLIPGSRRHPEKEMAIQSSIPACRIPWTEESGGLWSMGVAKNCTQLSD